MKYKIVFIVSVAILGGCGYFFWNYHTPKTNLPPAPPEEYFPLESEIPLDFSLDGEPVLSQDLNGQFFYEVSIDEILPSDTPIIVSEKIYQNHIKTREILSPDGYFHTETEYIDPNFPQ